VLSAQCSDVTSWFLRPFDQGWGGVGFPPFHFSLGPSNPGAGRVHCSLVLWETGPGGPRRGGPQVPTGAWCLRHKRLQDGKWAPGADVGEVSLCSPTSRLTGVCAQLVWYGFIGKKWRHDLTSAGELIKYVNWCIMYNVLNVINLFPR
jgi:hypothetical protein